MLGFYYVLCWLSSILFRPNFKNVDRLRTLINGIASDMAMSIADSGHAYAMSAAASNLTPAGRFGELFGGMSQVSIYCLMFLCQILLIKSPLIDFLFNIDKFFSLCKL